MITAAGYDPDSRELTVQFASGTIYTYEDVPESIYNGFLAANSQGAFFHKNIKGAFQAQKQ